jgi:allantoinase
VNQADLIIRGGIVVTPDAPTVADIAVSAGAITAIEPEIAVAAAAEIDATGLLVMPGAVDIHVHFNEPGRESWEGWVTGSAACAVGGTTTVGEMPLNARPPTLDGAAFDAKRRAAEAGSVVDFALWGGLTPGSLDAMEELAGRGVIGFKAFMANSGIDDFPAADDGTLFLGMQRAAALGLPIAVHAENDAITARLAQQATAAGRTGAADYLASRPAIAEVEAIGRAIALAAETGCVLHVVHVSTGRGIALIAEARARGVDVTAETCPHYLLLREDDLERLGAIAKCAPPLRTEPELTALWDAIARDDVEIVASDHSPAPPEWKGGNDFFRIWGGISGCQSLLGAILSEGHVRRGLPIERVSALLSASPARRFRLPLKGAIAVGYDADLTLVDPRLPGRLTSGDLRYRHRHSPFVGMNFAATVRRTIRRGTTVAINGRVVVRGGGELVTPHPIPVAVSR